MEMTNWSPGRYPVMPDFVGGTAAFTHTIDSAVHALEALDIAESRLTLRMAGPGRSIFQVVRQSPAPGVLLTPSVPIALWISGFGVFDALPLPMRESGGEVEMGTRELCSLFDDPLQKQAHLARVGTPLFQIGPDKLAACRRWLALFGIEPNEWPEELLYQLSLLVPTLASSAGREAGIRLAFLLLTGLPVSGFHRCRNYRVLPREEHSSLGSRACRLGRDFIAGDRQLDTDSITIRLGPVALETYLKFQSEPSRTMIQMISRLCVSAFQNYAIVWQVGDLDEAPRLGIASRNSRLGLNFHLGRGTST
jgi:hypothetical protein